MVAIIGARGSGKTALADLIARAGNSPMKDQQSFLQRAKGFVGSAKVSAEWAAGRTTEVALVQVGEEMPDVNYLTQQFVERLCSAEAESDELLNEIKRIVFLAHSDESRLGADSFDALVEVKSGQTRLALKALTQRLDDLSGQVLTERAWYLRRGPLQIELAKLKEEIARSEEASKKITTAGGKARSDYYARLSAAVTAREQQLQVLNRRLQDLLRLTAEIKRHTSEAFPQMLSDLRRAYSGVTLSDAQWAEFLPRFTGDPQAIVTEASTTLAGEIEKSQKSEGAKPEIGLTADQLGTCQLDLLKAAHTELGEQIGVDRKNIQRLQQLNQALTTQRTKLQRLEEQLARANESGERLEAVLAERGALYERFFQLIIEECDTLNQLYEPLEARLKAASSSAKRLRLRVRRQVDVDAWGAEGEELLDLRKAGKFKGRGTLADEARKSLLPAWQDGTANEVAEAMEAFRKENDKSLVEQAAVEPHSDRYQHWIVELGRWLYSTDHIKVHYSIEYDDVSITQLSPGTRGIVLLLLYLALDLEDARPLVIDQPEENLDPKSVYTELVGLFGEARTRRQVIIVTHNANLVVNTDVDQVIVASCVKHGGGSPPEFHYQSGGLEDSVIRAEVCEILEGGVAAFQQRARRLRLRTQ